MKNKMKVMDKFRHAKFGTFYFTSLEGLKTLLKTGSIVKFTSQPYWTIYIFVFVNNLLLSNQQNTDLFTCDLVKLI